jgi:oligoendopeptidase F
MMLRRVLMGLVSVALVQAAAAQAPPAGPDSAAVWDLSALYPDLAAWDAARRDAAAQLPALAALQGTLGESAAALRDGLSKISVVRKDVDRIGTYASLAADADQRVAEAIERRALAEQLDTDLDKAVSWLATDVLAIGADKIEAFIAAEPGLAPHAHALRNILRAAPHTLTPEGERIMAAVGTLRADPEQIYELAVNADIPWPTITLADGTQAKLDQAGYARHRQSPVRADRKAVFDAFWGTYGDYRDSIGAMLFAEVKGNVFNAKTRSHASALAAALFEDNLPEGVYRTLVAEVNAGLPVLHRYFKLRRRVLGIDDALRYYDVYPPMFSLERAFPLAETKALALAAAAPLGPDYVAALDAAQNGRWMHVYPAPGKRGGAYMNGSAYDVHPFILLNHNDDYDSLSTYVHEWGHGMHSLLANAAQPFETADYATFTAEIAAIVNEFLLNDVMVAQAATRQEKLFYLGEALESIRATMFRQVLFAEFELAIHEAVERGEALTGAKLSDIYCGILRRYHGHDQGVMTIDAPYCAEWAFVPHFYYDFYVFQYATSMAAAAHFAEEVKKGAGPRERYLDVLRAGGSDYAYDILKRAGLDMQSPAPYRAVIARMDRLVGEIETLLAQ